MDTIKGVFLEAGIENHLATRFFSFCWSTQYLCLAAVSCNVLNKRSKDSPRIGPTSACLTDRHS